MKLIGFYSDMSAFPWEMMHTNSHHIEVVDDVDGKGGWYVAHLRDPNIRDIMSRDPLSTVLPSANNPNSLKKQHVALLARHGVVSTDSHWTAHEKIAKSLGHSFFHPDY